jgi:hypothetical protein
VKLKIHQNKQPRIQEEAKEKGIYMKSVKDTEDTMRKSNRFSQSSTRRRKIIGGRNNYLRS